MLQEDYTSFRENVRDYLENSLPDTLKTDDLNVFISLITYIFGDLYEEAKKLPWEIDVDKCSSSNLKHLSSIVKYPWNNALTEEQQRETIKYWMLIRRNRGTKFSYINLIRLFGKDSSTFYSNSDHTGVRVVEYDPEITHEYELFPGDIRVEVPELSNILRNAMKDIRLMGTRIIFAFVLYLGAYNENINIDNWNIMTKWINSNLLLGWNPMIREFGPQKEFTILQSIKDWQLCIPSRSGEMFASITVLSKYRTPWVKGPMFNTPGLDNYRGIMTADTIITADTIMYR